MAGGAYKRKQRRLETEPQRGRPGEDRGRDWSDVATGRGTLGATAAGRRRQCPPQGLQHLEVPPTLPHLDFSPLAFRTVREDISVVLSRQVVVKVTGAPGPVPTSLASAPSPINCHPLQGRDSVPRASHIGGARATVSERGCTAFQAIPRTHPCSHLFCAEPGKAAGSGGCFSASSPGRWLPPLAVSPDGPWRPSRGLMCPSTYLVHLPNFSTSRSFPPLPRLLLPSDCPWGGGLKVPLGRRPGLGGWLPPRWGRRGRKGAGVALSPRATPVSLGRLGDQECGEGACSLQGGTPSLVWGSCPAAGGQGREEGSLNRELILARVVSANWRELGQTATRSWLARPQQSPSLMSPARARKSCDGVPGRRGM